MDNVTIKCENCGSICNVKDGYCKNCWKKLDIVSEQNDFILDGIGQSEWEEFIGKNANRYIEVYKKNNGNKIFLNMNWSAFFFSLNWVLYRKMYKVAIVGFVITSLISIILSTIFFLPHIDEIKELNNAIAPFHEYIENGGKTILKDSDGVAYSPEIVQKGAQAEKKLHKIESSVKLKTYLLTPVVFVFWGLFGDAIYKNHIKKYIKNKNGGTSISTLILGRILLGAISLFILNPLVSFIALALAN